MCVFVTPAFSPIHRTLRSRNVWFPSERLNKHSFVNSVSLLCTKRYILVKIKMWPFAVESAMKGPFGCSHWQVDLGWCWSSDSSFPSANTDTPMTTLGHWNGHGHYASITISSQSRSLLLRCCHVCSQTHKSQWRHNGRDGVLNHQPHDRLLNRLFRLRSTKTSKLGVNALCAANSPVTGEFPAR